MTQRTKIILEGQCLIGALFSSLWYINETTFSSEIQDDTFQAENTTNILAKETTNEIKEETEQAENTTLVCINYFFTLKMILKK